MEKRGISDVIVWVIGIALVLVAVGIIWSVLNSTIKENLAQTSSCSDVIGKVKINRVFSCIPAREDYALVGVNVQDINMDELIIGIEDLEGTTRTFKLENKEGEKDANVAMYEKGKTPNFGGEIIFPKANQGQTYVLNSPEAYPVKKITLTPVVDGNQCGVADSAEIEDCPASSKGLGLSCEIIAPATNRVVNYNTVKQTIVNFKYSGNPTNYIIVLGNFDGPPRGPRISDPLYNKLMNGTPMKNSSEELELCSVGPPIGDRPIQTLPITTTNGIQNYTCDWNDEISDWSYNDGNPLNPYAYPDNWWMVNGLPQPSPVSALSYLNYSAEVHVYYDLPKQKHVAQGNTESSYEVICNYPNYIRVNA